LVIFWPKQFDFSGGIAGFEPKDDKTCLGYSKWKQALMEDGSPIPDGGSSRYCYGIVLKK